MAGGVHAAVVPCLKCAGRADRISEGQENDYYRCDTCGYKFGIDWAYAGPPQKPCWPISEAEAAERRSRAAQVFGAQAGSDVDRASGATAASERNTK